jgi:hypothetical protein
MKFLLALCLLATGVANAQNLLGFSCESRGDDDDDDGHIWRYRFEID